MNGLSRTHGTAPKVGAGSSEELIEVGKVTLIIERTNPLRWASRARVPSVAEDPISTRDVLDCRITR
jgi:hypothetical protein